MAAQIIVEARALSSPGGGVKTYVQQLIQHLLPLLSEESMTILYDTKEAVMTLPGINNVVIPRWSKSLVPLWLNWQVPRRLPGMSPQVVHFTKSAVPARKQCATVVTIHDVIPILFPESQKLLRRLYWPKALRQAARQSDHILTDSEASKKDIVALLGAPEEKITVTPMAASNNFKPAPADDIATVVGRHKIKKPYVLFLGTIEPRKNLLGLVRSFAALAGEVPHTLVVAGRSYKGQDLVRREIRALNLERRVRWLDFVDTTELAALYSGADLFVWPSIYEGWGLPPLEAMSCGTPVLVSDGGSLPEVVGTAGEVVKFSTADVGERISDTSFEQRLTQLMGELLSDQARRLTMGQQSLKQAASFSWSATAAQTLAVYRQVRMDHRK